MRHDQHRPSATVLHAAGRLIESMLHDHCAPGLTLEHLDGPEPGDGAAVPGAPPTDRSSPEHQVRLKPARCPSADRSMMQLQAVAVPDVSPVAARKASTNTRKAGSSCQLPYRPHPA